MGSMFGGGSDVPPNSKLRNLDITPNQYKDLRTNYSDLFKSIFGGDQNALNTSLGAIPDYQGSYTAGMTGQEQSLIDQLFGNGLRGQTEGLLGDTMSGKYLSPDSNPYLKQTADAALGDLKYQWENYMMPQLRSQFTGAGQTLGAGTFGSSPFDRATALASNEFNRQSADMLTSIYGQNYQQERDRQMGAVPLQQQNTQELINTLQAVALPRLIEQYGIDQGVTEFRNRLNTLMQALGMGGQLSQVQQAGSTGTPQQDQSGQVIGGGVMAAGAVAAAFI